jgi:hypothetical protein
MYSIKNILDYHNIIDLRLSNENGYNLALLRDSILRWEKKTKKNKKKTVLKSKLVESLFLNIFQERLQASPNITIEKKA